MMNEKRRFTRVRWVNNSPAEEVPPTENDLTSWASPPSENNPSPWTFPSAENTFPQGTTLPVMPDPLPWAVPLIKPDPSPWTFPQEATLPAENSEMDAEEVLSEDDDDFFVENILYKNPEDENLAGEEYSPEDADQEEHYPSPEEDEHPLRNALLILVALYIICGLAPLFVALFVSLRIFFWTEIAGWLIILAWLVIWVRPPLTVWIKERLRARNEPLNGQLNEQFNEQL